MKLNILGLIACLVLPAPTFAQQSDVQHAPACVLTIETFIDRADFAQFRQVYTTDTIPQETKTHLLKTAQKHKKEKQKALKALGRSPVHTGKLVTGIAQSAVGLWCLLNTYYACTIGYHIYIKGSSGDTYPIPPIGYYPLMPGKFVPFYFTKSVTKSMGDAWYITFKPKLNNQKRALATGVTTSIVSSAGLSILSLTREYMNGTHSFTYKKRIQEEIKNLDSIIECLQQPMEGKNHEE
jgi:hypothetical protein